MLDKEDQIAIAVSKYNSNITDRLLEGARASLSNAGYDDSRQVIVSVPGAWEIPLAARLLAERADVAAVVTLAAVIRGETSHDQHINRAVSGALMNLMMETSKPIGFGVLTCNTLEQAIHRAGGNVGNKGCETADAVLKMLELGVGIPPATATRVAGCFGFTGSFVLRTRSSAPNSADRGRRNLFRQQAANTQISVA